VCDFHLFKLSGFVAWVIWLVVHLWYLVGFRNRLVVFTEWFFCFLNHGREARLITGARATDWAAETGVPEVEGRPAVGSDSAQPSS
jgi:NADH dehydrogenase